MHRLQSRLFVRLGALCCLAFWSGDAEAGRLFFSLNPTSPTDVFVSETTPVVAPAPNQPITVYIWYQRYGNTNGNTSTGQGDVLDGLSLDIISSSPFVTLTGFTVDNPNDTTITGEDRWGSIGFGDPPVAPLLVDDANAVKTGGSFIGKFFDPGRDPVTSAIPKTPANRSNAGVARFGTLTLVRTAAVGAEIRFRVGEQGISYTNASNPTDATNFGWGDAPIAGSNMGAASTLADLTFFIPEPSSVILLSVGAVGLLSARRRRAA